MASGAAWLAQRVGWGVVGREYLLAGHLIDRAGMPGVIGDYGKEVMTDVAIEEWRGASPVYTLRTRRLLGITTDDVEAIFKTMQFDIGAPHGFLDFRFEVLEPDHGEFSLAHCGALVDVEPMGVEFVEAMCHTIEDPTFDATAAATNPRARVRPIHRPPRAPADRVPHCRWSVRIDAAAAPLPFPAEAIRIGQSVAGRWPIPVVQPGAASDGWTDYAAALDPQLALEVFAPVVVEALCEEWSLQGHLLGIAFAAALARRGLDVDKHLAAQLVGAAGVAARRMARLVPEPHDLTALTALLAAHPLFGVPGYLDLVIDTSEVAAGHVGIGVAGAALAESALGWGTALRDPAVVERVVRALVREYDPAVHVVADSAGRTTCRLVAGRADEPDGAEVAVAGHDEAVELASFSSGVEFVLPLPAVRSPAAPMRGAAALPGSAALPSDAALPSNMEEM